MKKKKMNSFVVQRNENIADMNIIKNTIRKLHGENKDDVPEYLDELKKKEVKD